MLKLTKHCKIQPKKNASLMQCVLSKHVSTFHKGIGYTMIDKMLKKIRGIPQHHLHH